MTEKLTQEQRNIINELLLLDAYITRYTEILKAFNKDMEYFTKLFDKANEVLK